jgi:hypothetical protein
MKGPRVTFPGRTTGLVHVRGRLQLPSGTPFIDVSFRREHLIRIMRKGPRSSLVALAMDVFLRLSDARRALLAHRPGSPWYRHEPTPPALRRRRLTLHGCYLSDPGLPYTIRISKPDLERLVELVEWGPDGDTNRVHTEIQILFSEPTLAAVAAGRRLPRGARPHASDLLIRVRWALLEAEQLCQVARADATVRERIKGVLGEDFDAKFWRQNAILLVSRAFRPAWARYGIKPPDARTAGDASDAYKALLPASYRKDVLASFKKSMSMRGAPEGMAAWVHATWTERLLGPEGQAARDFDLV